MWQCRNNNTKSAQGKEILWEFVSLAFCIIPTLISSSLILRGGYGIHHVIVRKVFFHEQIIQQHSFTFQRGQGHDSRLSPETVLISMASVVPLVQMWDQQNCVTMNRSSRYNGSPSEIPISNTNLFFLDST